MKKVILIEDEPALQESLSIALKSKGIDVISAFDGESGLNLIIKMKPDLILLDLILPKMDGFTILDNVKKNPEVNNIPIIVLTNLDDDRYIQRVIGLGVTSYLIKSNYNSEEISNKVKDILKI
ncbi:MAG: response regulator [Patescibacteria group bacterium]